MADLPRSILRMADLATGRPTAFSVTPDVDERQAVAQALGIRSIKKLRLSGQLAPVGGKDWALTADLGATVIQECVVTLGPVTTRIDEPVARTYMAEMSEIEASEVEMAEDDSVEQLPASLDLAAVMIEALSLALPLYPRAEGADLGEAVFAAPGTTAMTDEDTKPFAGLGALRDSLKNKGE